MPGIIVHSRLRDAHSISKEYPFTCTAAPLSKVPRFSMSTAIRPAPTTFENMKPQLKRGMMFSRKTTAPKALKLHSRQARA